MKMLPRLALLACPLVLAALLRPCLGAQTLPDGWWLQDSPENVLAKAQTINRNLNYYQAEKSGSTSSAITNPFAKTNAIARTDFFQKRNANGVVETKKVILDGNFRLTDYKLEIGNYVFTEGQIIKSEFADGDDRERPIAAKFDHPYDFKILKSEMVGTNDCIVIARCMTPEFLDAIKAIYYKNDTKEQEAAFGDPKKFIGSETDYYFRKSDGVTCGQLFRNHLGEELENDLYDKVEINQPISDSEFSLPNGNIKTAKSMEEFVNIVDAARAAKFAKTRKSPATLLLEKRVSALPWATDLPQALAAASSQNKIVVLDFTGSDWCVWCVKFEDDILSQPEFAAYAKTNLVLVKLDFPRKTKQSQALKQANEDLQEKFKVDGFPTYVALSPDGKEIGRQVGYLNGGPETFIALLEQFRKH
jgi:protein disulfide-isomerase